MSILSYHNSISSILTNIGAGVLKRPTNGPPAKTLCENDVVVVNLKIFEEERTVLKPVFGIVKRAKKCYPKRNKQIHPSLKPLCKYETRFIFLKLRLNYISSLYFMFASPLCAKWNQDTCFAPVWRNVYFHYLGSNSFNFVIILQNVIYFLI